MLTCYGALSRNRSVGVRLGKGEKLEDILASSSQVRADVKVTWLEWIGSTRTGRTKQVRECSGPRAGNAPSRAGNAPSRAREVGQNGAMHIVVSTITRPYGHTPCHT